MVSHPGICFNRFNLCPLSASEQDLTGILALAMQRQRGSLWIVEAGLKEKQASKRFRGMEREREIITPLVCYVN